MSDLKVHPFADLFPMFPKDELQALADDIQANGLIHPVVRDADDQIIDGRNRLAACAMVDVEPTYELLPDDQDPVLYIMSANVDRRMMTPSQRAIMAAKAYLHVRSLNFETQQETHGTRSHASNENGQKAMAKRWGTSAGYFQAALAVVQYAEECVPQILADQGSVQDAYERFAKPRMAAEVAEQQIIARLRFRHPSIYARLEAKEITPHQAALEAQATEEAELLDKIQEERRTRNVRLAKEKFEEKPIPAVREIPLVEARDASVKALDVGQSGGKERAKHLEEEHNFAIELLNIKERVLARAESGFPEGTADWTIGPAYYAASWAADMIAGINDILAAVELQGTALRKVK